MVTLSMHPFAGSDERLTYMVLQLCTQGPSYANFDLYIEVKNERKTGREKMRAKVSFSVFGHLP
jgi:hypothetical protein